MSSRMRKAKTRRADPFANWTREQFEEQQLLALERAKADPKGAALHYTQAGAWQLRAEALMSSAPLFYALKNCIQRIERPEMSPGADVVLEQAHAAIDLYSK